MVSDAWKPYWPFIVRQLSRRTASVAANMPPPGTLRVTVLLRSRHPPAPVWLMAVWSTYGVNLWMVRYWMVTSVCSPIVMLLSMAVRRRYWPSRTLPRPLAYPPTNTSPELALKLP